MTTLTVRNKIGFHTGPAGNRTGINRGGFMERLTQARIPFMIKSVDDYGPCFEAVEHIQKSGVPHIVVYRLSSAGQNTGYTFDIPRYDDFPNDPHAGAVKHWQKTLERLPREFNKEHVWLELINEVDRNRCDWLGQFAVHCAEFALRDGYKITLFGWSSGEPEKSGWEQPGMLAYLRLCAQQPNRLAVSVHEYSYNKENIQDGFPYKLGRFKELFQVCDEQGIPRPKVHITEWGWEYRNVPSPERAMEDIRWANKLYGPYPEIQGAAIWYLGLGGEFGDIHNQTQRLIAPLTELTLNEMFTVELDVPMTTTSPAASTIAQPGTGSPETKTTEPPVATAESPVTTHPPVTTTPPATTSKPATTEKPASTDQPTTPKPTTTQSTSSAAAPQKPPTTTSQTTATQPPTTTTPASKTQPQVTTSSSTSQPVSGKNQLVFVADVTIPDYTRLKPGQSFTKIWRVKNSGETTWGEGYKLVFVPNLEKGGKAMSERVSFALAEVASKPTVAPGETVEIRLPLTAPMQARPKFDFSDWKLQDPSGRVFDDFLYVIIVVDPKA